MRLRELEEKDAPYMLEWMHDDSVTHDLKTDFASKSLTDCQNFIANSMSEADVNYAITEDDNDEYLGTVSLKHIENGNAEFAITIRKQAMGSGVASEAMSEIFRIAFEEKGLRNVYWCVSPNNKRAVRFYDKNGYTRDCSCFEFLRGGYTPEEIPQYIWYLERRQNTF